MMRTLLSVSFSLCITFSLHAQVPMGGNCGTDLVLSAFCVDACVTCDGLDGFADTNSNGAGQAPPGHCAPQIHNPRWIGFVAGTSSLSFDINVGSCVQGDGLQIGVFTTPDCTNFAAAMNCNPGIPPFSTETFSSNNLTVGGTYFIVIDGSFDDVCDFDIQINSGSMTAPDLSASGPAQISGVDEICPGGTAFFSATPEVFGAGIYTWVFQGMEVGYEQQQQITFPTTPGTYQICVTPSNPCSTGTQGCKDVVVAEPAVIVEPDEVICFGDNIQFHGVILFETGDHSVTELTPEGCMQEYQIHLDVVQPTAGPDENIVLCEGEIFWTGGGFGQGFAIDMPGVYPFILTSAQGCDSLQTFIVDFMPSYDETISPSICQGESFTVSDTQGNSYTYSTQVPGGHVADLLTVDGCDSTVNVMLTVAQPSMEVIDETICPGEVYLLNGTTYTMTGTFTEMLPSASGCDSVITLNLTVDNPVTNLGDISICPDGSYTIAGNTFNGAGDYSYMLPSAQGCDSIINLTLIEPADIETTLTESICDDEVYTFDGTDYNTTGMYEVVYSAVGGCDSTVTLDLTVLETPETDILTQICTGQSFDLGGELFDMTGVYVRTFTAANGCDSTVTLDLTVGDGFITNLNPVICDMESFDVAGETLTVGGMYSYDLTSGTGCDSTVNVNLTVLPIATGVQPASICDGESFDYEGNSYTVQGQYDVTLTGPNGCDSIVTIDLTVRQPVVTNLNEQICTGQSYTVGSSTYDTDGTYQDILTGANGCDSTVNLMLTLTDVIVETADITICDDESVMVGSNTYNQTGMYQDNFITSSGCDSTYVLNLTVNESLTTDLDISICNGETYDAGGVTHSTTGVFVYNLSSAITGCDSTVTLDLEVRETPEVFLTPSICSGESVTVGMNTYTTTGNYTDVLTAANGCDSTVFTNLIVRDVPTIDQSPIICDGESVAVGPNTYTTTGMYQDVLVAANGCDSIVTTQLTVLDVPEFMQAPVLCEGESITVGPNTYTTSGSYTDVLVAANGCDSIVMTELLVNPTYEIDIDGEVCVGGSYSIAGQTFTDGGDYDIMLQTGEGCDSLLHLHLVQTPFLQTNLVEAICDGESYRVGTTDYMTTGNFSETFTSVDGCDSIVNLDLTVNNLPLTNLPVEICDGESFDMGGESFNTTGVFTRVYPSALTGCDSTVMLDLTVNPVYVIDRNERICDGENVTIGNSVYTETGDYSDTFTTADGCDSTILLHLIVDDIPLTELNETICEGESVMVGGTAYSDAGTHVETLTAVTGCDSIVTLNLEVIDLVTVTLNEAICDGETYTVGSSSYTTTGDYTDVLTSVVSGCDSVVNLALRVDPVYDITLTESICDDSSFPVGNESFSTAGTYVVPLQSAEGCDSIVTLNLSTFPCQLQVATTTVDISCNGGSDGSFTLTVNVGTPPFLVTWLNFDTFESGQFTLDALSESGIADNLSVGPHVLSVEDANNIIYSTEVIINQPAALELTLTPSDYNGFNTSCADAADGFIDATITGGTPPYDLSWSAGTNENLPEGDYTLLVTDANGCEITAATSLQAPNELRASLLTQDPPCADDRQGSIIVENAGGGTPPYLYSINGSAYTASPLFASLPTGNHVVEIQDANGCSWRQETTIFSKPELTVELGDDIPIELGDSIQLFAQTSRDVVNFNWQAGGPLTCNPTSNDCSDPFVSPQETTTYRVTVVDENGCTGSDQIVVYVDKPRDVFIPTGFSPNGDGSNDLFMIFAGNDVASIRNLHIFNRWGETIISIPGPFPANDPDFGWDGMHRGQMMNAGVYVYFAEVEFIDGERVLFKGEVILLR